MSGPHEIRADILARLLLIQETLDVLPERESIAAFMRRSLRDVPGVQDSLLYLEGTLFPPSAEYEETAAHAQAAWQTSGCCKDQLIDGQRVISLPLRTARKLYGMLILSLDDETAFEPYRAFVRNVNNVVAATLEIREHIRRLDEARAALEAQVHERTATLRVSEEKFRALVETTRDWVWEVDAHGAYIYSSPRVEQLLGYTPDEVVGKTPFDFMRPAEAQRVAATFQSAMQSAVPFDQVINVNRHRDGHEVVIESSGTPVLNELGAVVGYRGIDRDFTARQRVEDALARLAFELKEAQRLARIGSWDWDAVTDSITWSEEYYRIFGFDPSLPPPGYAEHLAAYTPDSASRLDAAVARSMETGEGYELDLEMASSGGRPRWITARSEVKRDAVGRIVGLRGTAEDITERKQMQAQLLQAQKLESVGRLAGGVAHDFNNMLTAILANADLTLLSVGDNEEATQGLEEIRAAAQRSANLTRQLLAFARKESIAPKVLDLNDAVEGILKMLQRVIGEYVRLEWKPGASLWNVTADPAQIDQVLANLAVNARDAMTDEAAMQGRSARLEVATANVVLDEAAVASHPDCVPGQYVMLQVTDNGCGMDAHTLANVFEPFYTTKADGHGTGLGMATVYGIVKQHKGLIVIQSALGSGTTVSLYLPRVLDAAAPDAKASARPRRRGGETILLVDDEVSVRLPVARMLKHLGYRVLVASGSAEALNIADTHADRVDLLLTDVIMPGMNGVQLRDELRRRRPGLKTLCMSGYAGDLLPTVGHLTVGTKLLRKPITLEQLEEAVAQCLDDSPAPSDNLIGAPVG